MAKKKKRPSVLENYLSSSYDTDAFRDAAQLAESLSETTAADDAPLKLVKNKKEPSITPESVPESNQKDSSDNTPRDTIGNTHDNSSDHQTVPNSINQSIHQNVNQPVNQFIHQPTPDSIHQAIPHSEKIKSVVCGLTESQAVVLQILITNTKRYINIVQLSAKLNISEHTIRSIIKSLCKFGYIIKKGRYRRGVEQGTRYDIDIELCDQFQNQLNELPQSIHQSVNKSIGQTQHSSINSSNNSYSSSSFSSEKKSTTPACVREGDGNDPVSKEFEINPDLSWWRENRKFPVRKVHSWAKEFEVSTTDIIESLCHAQCQLVDLEYLKKIQKTPEDWLYGALKKDGYFQAPKNYMPWREARRLQSLEREKKRLEAIEQRQAEMEALEERLRNARLAERHAIVGPVFEMIQSDTAYLDSSLVKKALEGHMNSFTSKKVREKIMKSQPLGNYFTEFRGAIKAVLEEDTEEFETWQGKLTLLSDRNGSK